MSLRSIPERATSRMKELGLIQEISPDTLNSQAYDMLVDAILSLGLRPGSKLHVGKLAKAMGLSPTPIKQALMKLVGEGLVTNLPRRGFYVAWLSREQVGELYDCRLMCELYAAECIVDTRPESFLAALAQVEMEYRQLIEQGADARARLLKERDFHRLIVDQVGNRMLSEWYRRLNVHAHGIRIELLGREVREPMPGYADHGDIVRAFTVRDLEAVKRATRRDVEEGRANALRSLAAVSESPEK